MSMSYRVTGEEIEARVRAAAAARRERERLRSLVGRIDALIAACEEAHLGRQQRVTATLAALAAEVFAEARDVLGNAPEGSFLGARITDLMDAAWELQDQAFDRLLPERTELPEDVGEPASWSSAA